MTDENSPPDARAFANESPLPDSGEPLLAKRLDLTMMVRTGGRERTEAESVDLLERAGWELAERHDPEEGPLSVLEAVAV